MINLIEFILFQLKDAFEFEGEVTKMGINVTLAPMDDDFMIHEDIPQNGANNLIDPVDLLEKENVSLDPPINQIPPVSASSSSPAQLSNEELIHLRQCRNRAYSKVNQKKRLHMNASLSQYIHKEWLSIYPGSQLSGKRLLEIYDTSASSIMDETKKSNKGRKRKPVESAPIVEAPVIKKTKSEVVHGDHVISEATHEDRQWSSAMLSNLMYCNKVAETKTSDLETEWLILYPNSVLTARNLKSRLTVYQRTHSEKSAPKKPTREKEKVVKTPKVVKSQSEPSKVIKPITTWTEEMVKDMIDTLEKARDELNSSDNAIVAPRWFQLWSEKHPDSSVDVESLHNKYLDHVKQSSLSSPRKSPQVLIENCLDKSDKSSSSTSDIKTEETNTVESVEQDVKSEDCNDVGESLEADPEASCSTLVNDIFSWSQELIEELQREQKYVEEKLRCIQDEYFYELLQERWTNIHSNCRDTPEQLRNILQTNIKKESETPGEDLNVKEEAATEMKDEDETLHLDIKTDVSDNIEQDDTEDVKEEIDAGEVEELPKSKWICDRHYIHLFYDDQDKSHECILTEQLLNMRNDLIPKFPAHDLFKGGKKPPGFAKMLLSQWLQVYPGKIISNCLFLKIFSSRTVMNS